MRTIEEIIRQIVREEPAGLRSSMSGERLLVRDELLMFRSNGLNEDTVSHTSTARQWALVDSMTALATLEHRQALG